MTCAEVSQSDARSQLPPSPVRAVGATRNAGCTPRCAVRADCCVPDTEYISGAGGGHTFSTLPRPAPFGFERGDFGHGQTAGVRVDYVFALPRNTRTQFDLM